MLTRDAIIVQSSHQNGAADIFLASNRAATATVAAMTVITLPSHTFHAKLLSGGKDMARLVLSQKGNVRREKDRAIVRFNKGEPRDVQTAADHSRCYPSTFPFYSLTLEYILLTILFVRRFSQEVGSSYTILVILPCQIKRHGLDS